jgi:ABC-2 type transport system permease protein
MKHIWIIAKREVASYFDSLIAYIMIVAFLGFSGFFTWLFGSDIFLTGQASLQVFFGVAYWTLFFFIPAITMRLLAEEHRSGTLELLFTMPVNHFQIVTGKFLSTLLLILISLLLTLPYFITITSIGPADAGVILSGYLGLILISCVYASIGLFASSTTNNQIVSFLLAMFIGIFFHFLFGLIAGNFTGFMGNLFYFLSTQTHFESVSRGVIDSRDIIYFLSVTVLGLLGSSYFIVKKYA